MNLIPLSSFFPIPSKLHSNNYPIIKIQINEAMLLDARKKAKSLGILRGSIEKGKGNIIGYLGENLVQWFLPLSQWIDSYDYDILFKYLRIDVKTKKVRTEPKLTFECSVPSWNTTQQCDIYLFTKILVENNSYPYGWILGYIWKQEFYSKAVFHPKGELDPTNNFVFKTDSYNVPISELYPISKLLDYQISFRKQLDLTNWLRGE